MFEGRKSRLLQIIGKWNGLTTYVRWAQVVRTIKLLFIIAQIKHSAWKLDDPHLTAINPIDFHINLQKRLPVHRLPVWEAGQI
jgi:hypothetical protein